MFPASWGILSAADGTGGLSLADYIHVLGECHPNLKPRILFFLLGILVLFPSDYAFGIANNTFITLLHLLESFKERDVDSEWLALSKEYFEHSAGAVGGTFDLLQRSLDALDQIELIEGVDSSLVSSVRGYLVNIKGTRDDDPSQPRSKEKT